MIADDDEEDEVRVVRNLNSRGKLFELMMTR